MAKSVTSEKLKAVHARLSFPNLDTPTSFKPDQEPKCGFAILLDPSRVDHKALIDKTISEGDRIANQFWDGKIPKSLERCYGWGDELDKVYDGYAGMFYVKVKGSSQRALWEAYLEASKSGNAALAAEAKKTWIQAARIPVVGRRKNAQGKFDLLQPGHPEWPFGGSYVNASFSIWTQDNHGRKAINGNALGVQFNEKGPAFSNKQADPDSEFDALEDGEGEDPFAES